MSRRSSASCVDAHNAIGISGHQIRVDRALRKGTMRGSRLDCLQLVGPDHETEKKEKKCLATRRIFISSPRDDYLEPHRIRLNRAIIKAIKDKG